MRTFDSDPVEVRLDACYCPGSPHEADLVYLAPQLSMSGGMAAQSAISAGISDPIVLQEMLAEVWVRFGVISWNLVDDDGPLEVNPANVAAALPYGKGGRLVAERADDLYAEDILAPLVSRLRPTSQRGRTNGSTSATPRRTRKRPSPSSTATTDKALPSA
jgi:hypothetical protein